MKRDDLFEFRSWNSTFWERVIRELLTCCNGDDDEENCVLTPTYGRAVFSAYIRERVFPANLQRDRDLCERLLLALLADMTSKPVAALVRQCVDDFSAAAYLAARAADHTMKMLCDFCIPGMRVPIVTPTNSQVEVPPLFIPLAGIRVLPYSLEAGNNAYFRNFVCANLNDEKGAETAHKILLVKEPLYGGDKGENVHKFKGVSVMFDGRTLLTVNVAALVENWLHHTDTIVRSSCRQVGAAPICVALVPSLLSEDDDLVAVHSRLPSTTTPTATAVRENLQTRWTRQASSHDKDELPSDDDKEPPRQFEAWEVMDCCMFDIPVSVEAYPTRWRTIWDFVDDSGVTIGRGPSSSDSDSESSSEEESSNEYDDDEKKNDALIAPPADVKFHVSIARVHSRYLLR